MRLHRFTHKAKNDFSQYGLGKYDLNLVCEDEELKEIATFEYTNRCIDKLGQLEDIEEELGIDLIILVKALKNGIVLANEKPRKRPCQLRMFYEKPMLVVDYGDGTCSEVYVAGYKNSWALTKEELL